MDRQDGRAEAARRAAVADAGHDALSAWGHVLIVEPDAVVASLFVEVLDEEGYMVACAAGPREALALLCTGAAQDVDLVLSAPCANPHTASYDWLDQLRACTTAPIVICSRWPAACYADHRRRGFAAVLTEPCDLDDLIALVAVLCSGTGEDARTIEEGASLSERGRPEPTLLA